MHPLCKFNNYFRIFISIAPTGHVLVKDFEKAAKAPSIDLHRQNYDSIVSFRETEYEKSEFLTRLFHLKMLGIFNVHD